MEPTSASRTPFRFAISATFNAEPLEAGLRFWAANVDVPLEVRFAPFNQPLQSLLDPTGVLAENHDGLNVLLLRLEDLGQVENPQQLEDNVQHIADAARHAGAGMASPLLVVLCPPSHMEADSIELWLAGALKGSRGVYYLSFRDLAQRYPVADPHNPLGEKLGGIPYTDLYFAALATALMRHAHALWNAPYKVIALDCDNTLWQGICGEDGPTGVRLDAAREALQLFMARQREAGMLLAMVSKNNEEDVMETFAKNPHMPLSVRDFVAWRINWESKAENLASLAADLNLGLDSFIFVDDNPRECGEVEEMLPEVLSLALPAKDLEIPHFLEHVWAFDRLQVTSEDRKRSQLYQQSQEFGRALKSAESMLHFYDTLQLEVQVAKLSEDRLARSAQLTQRTNQFNASTTRRSEVEMLALAKQKGWAVLTVDAADRFGDYGQVGVMILREAAPALEVETILLSCRALGRGVEHHMLRYAGEYARTRNLSRVFVPLTITARNAPALRFLESIGPGQETEQGLIFSYEATALANLNTRPKPAAPPVESGTPVAAAGATRQRLVDYARIARSLSRPEQVLAGVRAAGIKEAPLVAGTETEQALAHIWCELLGKTEVRLEDNFFDLGGHSLQAVLLLLRVKEAFGVELEIDDVYSGTATLSTIAALIDARQLEAANPEEYAALLAQIEQLSEEEIQALLAEHEQGGAGN